MCTSKHSRRENRGSEERGSSPNGHPSRPVCAGVGRVPEGVGLGLRPFPGSHRPGACGWVLCHRPASSRNRPPHLGPGRPQPLCRGVAHPRCGPPAPQAQRGLSQRPPSFFPAGCTTEGDVLLPPVTEPGVPESQAPARLGAGQGSLSRAGGDSGEGRAALGLGTGRRGRPCPICSTRWFWGRGRAGNRPAFASQEPSPKAWRPRSRRLC